MKEFAHLSIHTEYSRDDSIIRIQGLVEHASERGLSALAITDRRNLFAMWKFQKAMLSAGIKPIIGVDFEICDDGKNHYRIIVLAKDESGLRKLFKLMTQAYRNEDMYGCLKTSHVLEKQDGLILLSGGVQGEIGQLLIHRHADTAYTVAKRYREVFGDRFYIEVSRTGRENEEAYISHVLPLADQLDLPIVATNDVRFIDRSDFDVHETRYCIAAKCRVGDGEHAGLYSEEQYLRSAEEMHEKFSDLPDAIENAVEIAKRCSVKVQAGTHLPLYKTKNDRSAEDALDLHAREKLEELFNAKEFENLVSRRKEYESRLEHELQVIKGMGFAGYFLIVADIVMWAKSQDIPVGPGRGSGAASLVAYVLGITAIDPIVHELMFERLLNPERVSLPDIDVDICTLRRGEVMNYITELYGSDHVSQIVTFGTLGARAVIRDVARVHGKPYALGERICALIPDRLDVKLNDAIHEVQELNDLINTDSDVREVVQRSRQIEGLVRNYGTHPGGTVIAPSIVDDFVPCYLESPDSDLTSQMDKDDVEQIGLLKFDFLGLKTVTVVASACDLVNRRRKVEGADPIDAIAFPLEDKKVFKLLCDVQTTGVFQLESAGMRRTLRDLQPDSLGDISAILALFRPGPMQFIDQFIRRKNGEETVEYSHPLLERVLEKTYGLMVYQEDVMSVAKELAGFSLEDADRLRRAMGKKDETEMVEQRTQFIHGCIENDVPEEVANAIFDDMEKFAQYAFNKAHAAGYAVTTYQTAYLKAHYPVEFLAAALTCDVMIGRKDILKLIDEARRMNIELLKPCVNQSDYEFTSQNGNIRTGLGAIKRLGREHAKQILEARPTGGFDSLFDLCNKSGLQKTHRISLETLVLSGALDELSDGYEIGQLRANLMAQVKTVTAAVEQNAMRSMQQIDDLFGTVDQTIVTEASEDTSPMTNIEALREEHSALGYFVSGHPVQEYRQELKTLCTLQDLTKLPSCKSKGNVDVAGFLRRKDSRITRRGESMSVIILEDEYGPAEISIYSEEYRKYRDKLNEGSVMVVKCTIRPDSSSDRVMVRGKEIYQMDEARSKHHARLEIDIADEEFDEKLAQRLHQGLLPHCGKGSPVFVNYKNGDYSAKIKLGESWHVPPTDEVLHKLSQEFGPRSVRFTYSTG